jgi:hypothetical protein
MMKKILLSSLLLVSLTSCSEFALLASGSSLAISQNSYARAYNGIDVLTIMNTDQSIKGHIYEQLRSKTKAK